MKLPLITTLAIALGFLSVTFTEAKVYKWKDAEGVMHYSSVPPKPTEKITHLKDDLKITDNKAIADDASEEDKPKEKTEEKKERTNGNEDIEKANLTNKQNFCDGQRKNLELLKRNHKVKWIENGKDTELTADQRKDKIRLLEDSVNNDCNNNDQQTGAVRKPNALNETVDEEAAKTPPPSSSD